MGCIGREGVRGLHKLCACVCVWLFWGSGCLHAGQMLAEEEHTPLKTLPGALAIVASQLAGPDVIILAPFFLSPCIASLSVNPSSVWQRRGICICALKIKSKLESICVNTLHVPVRAHNYECTVSDGLPLSVGMFIRRSDFNPPAKCRTLSLQRGCLRVSLWQKRTYAHSTGPSQMLLMSLFPTWAYAKVKTCISF